VGIANIKITKISYKIKLLQRNNCVKNNPHPSSHMEREARVKSNKF
jgi:hypothetical protein